MFGLYQIVILSILMALLPVVFNRDGLYRMIILAYALLGTIAVMVCLMLLSTAWQRIGIGCIFFAWAVCSFAPLSREVVHE